MKKKIDQKHRELYDKSLPFVQQKDDSNKAMWDIAKQLSGMTGIDKVNFIKYKDFLYYYGRGWTSDALSLAPLQDENYPDRTSKKFIAILDIINILRSINQLSTLKPYLDAMSARGINITISETEPVVEDISEYSSEVNTMVDLQGIICEMADIVKEDHASMAEGLNMCKKNRYVDLAKSYKNLVSEKSHKKDKVREKLNKDITELKLVENRKEEIVHV